MQIHGPIASSSESVSSVLPFLPAHLVTQARSQSSVTLIDGSEVSLCELTTDELIRLQYEQERQFAEAIKSSPKDSLERELTIKHAYQTVCQILDEQATREGSNGTLSMGMDRRYKKLVLELLAKRRQSGSNDRIFEVGFGSGLLLKAAAEAGYGVGGLEVAPQLFELAASSIAAEHRQHLLLGDFRSLDLSDHFGQYGIVYWNDVMEHIATDEVDEYLVQIRKLLVDGGILITITPNWHMRPSDITSSFFPPRTEAIGFHLKEYKLRETCKALRNAGFTGIITPTFISRQQIMLPRWFEMTWAKTLLEPLLEWLPFPVTVQCCRRFGFNLTIATAASSPFGANHHSKTLC